MDSKTKQEIVSDLNRAICSVHYAEKEIRNHKNVDNLLSLISTIVQSLEGLSIEILKKNKGEDI